jgi:hypothetical protein
MTMDAERNDTVEYRGWEVRVLVQAGSDGSAGFAGHAELWLNGNHKCRIVLASSRPAMADARSALETKAHAFIDDWITRAHTGTTMFGELESD